MRILLTRLSALGDIVHTWPLAQAITAAGDHELAWLVEEPFAPLVASHPAVAVGITVATRRWRQQPAARRTREEIRAALRAIAGFAPDLAIDPQGLCKSAVWAALARVPRRIGLASSARRERCCGLLYTEVARPPDDAVHVIDVNLTLLAAIAIERPRGAVPDGRFLVGGDSPPAWLPRGSVSLLPATGGPGKAWGWQAYADLAGRLQRTGLPVTVLWGPGEQAVAQAIASGASPPARLAPPTSLLELAAALRHSAVVVGGDTGPIHLAASLGTATIALMLATDPDRNGPRGDRVTVLSGAVGTARRGSARTRRGDPPRVEDVERAALAHLSSVPIGRVTMAT